MLAGLVARAKARGLPYLIVGGVNTALAYGVTVGLYYLLPSWSIVAIGVLSNIITITISFTNFKMFIFKSNGFWLTEYLRCYMVYGGTALFGIAELWLLVDVLHITIWLSQGLVMAAAVPLSFLGHEFFTFRMCSRRTERDAS